MPNRICEDCGVNTDHVCSSCQGEFILCTNCCDIRRYGEEERNNEQVDIIELPFEKLTSSTYEKNKFKNFCGVEIEACNSDFSNLLNMRMCKKYSFSQTEDGSLNEGEGVEFVSQAMNGDLLFNKVIDFGRYLKENDFYVNSKCGLHIHIGDLPKSAKFISGLVALYAKYEHLIFSMIPKERRLNNYCKAFSQTITKRLEQAKTLKSIYEVLYLTSQTRYVKREKRNKYNSVRYFWLNLHSLFHRGTIEIRNHSGTINPKKINEWLTIHLTLCNMAKKNKHRYIKAMPNTPNFFLSLFPVKTQKYIISRWRKHNPVLLETEETKITDIVGIMEKMAVSEKNDLHNSLIDRDLGQGNGITPPPLTNLYGGRIN